MTVRWVSWEYHAYGGALLADTYDLRMNRWVSTELRQKENPGTMRSDAEISGWHLGLHADPDYLRLNFIVQRKAPEPLTGNRVSTDSFFRRYG